MQKYTLRLKKPDHYDQYDITSTIHNNNSFTEIWWFNDFQNGGRTPTWIVKICSFCHAAVAISNFKTFWSRDRNRVQYLMLCTKFYWNRKIFHWDMAIKWFSKWRPSSILDFKNLQFFHVAFVGMRFCVLTQNFAEIGQSVDELQPKKAIFKMAIGAILNFKTFNFWSRDCNWVHRNRIFFSLRHGDLTIFKMAAVRHLGF